MIKTHKMKQMKISSLHEKEFRVIIVKVIQNLGNELETRQIE